MIDRRDMLAGLGCAAILGTAEWLRPRRSLVLMPEGAALTEIVPARVGSWSSSDGGDIVIPRTEGSLAATLYSDQLARSYQYPADDRPDVMILAAYGRVQNDALQLHRPEVCYPAVGFEIVERRFIDIPSAAAKPVPAVALTARAGDRVEDIVYWTRVGDDLPRTASEQRNGKLIAAMAGYVGDGVLFRSSAVRSEDGGPLFDELLGFLGSLINALSPNARVALLGRTITG